MTTLRDVDDSVHVLDDPVGASLRSTHAVFARTRGRASAYDPAVASFVHVPPDASADDWSDLAGLLGPGGFADLFSSPAEPPADWSPVFTLAGVQLVGPVEPDETHDADVVELTAADVPAMRALAAETRPGPFWARTAELGTYVGVRDGERPVAMAGVRLRPPGWSELSAVCTAPSARGRGLASRLVRALTARVVAQGDAPFLHVAADNTAALALYERLGFVVRRAVVFRGFTVPG